MNATQTLPENYRLSAGFNLKDRKMLLIMNAAGLVLLVLFGWLFTKLAIWLRPADATTFLTLQLGGDWDCPDDRHRSGDFICHHHHP